MINLDDFIKFYIRKWKVVLCIISVFIVLFVSATKILGNEIVVENSEQYVYYEEKLIFHEEYLKESILMSANPASLYVSTALLKNVSDEDVLYNYVVSTEIWDDFETDMVKKYLPELVKWKFNESTGVVEISLRHTSTERSSSCLKYLLGKIKEKDTAVEIIEGAERVEIDEELQDLQNDWYNRINYLKGRLEEAEAGFTIYINVLAAAITGAFIGGIVSLAIILLVYILKRETD